MYRLYKEPALRGHTSLPAEQEEKRRKADLNQSLFPGILQKNEVGKTTCHCILCLVSSKSCLLFPPSLREPINRPSAQPIHRPKMEYIVSGGGLYSNRSRTGKDFLYFLIYYILFCYLISFLLDVLRCTAVKSIFNSIKLRPTDLAAIFKKLIFVILFMRARSLFAELLGKGLRKTFPPNISRIWLIYGRP